MALACVCLSPARDLYRGRVEAAPAALRGSLQRRRRTVASFTRQLWERPVGLIGSATAGPEPLIERTCAATTGPGSVPMLLAAGESGATLGPYVITATPDVSHSAC